MITLHVGGGLLGGDLLGGDLLGGDMLGGLISGGAGDDGSLLNLHIAKTGEDGDDSIIDIDADGLLGDGNAVSGIVEMVEDTADEVTGEMLGGDLLGGDLLGGDLLSGDLLGNLDLGETLAQLGGGDSDLLGAVTNLDLSDVGAITNLDLVDGVVDTATSAVDGLLGETDLFNILDTDGLLGDG